MNPNVRSVNAPHNLRPVSGVSVTAVTIAGTAGTLEGLGSFTFDSKCQYVQVGLETNPVRVDPHGGTPTASAGQLINAGQTLLLSIAEARSAKWIRTGSSATAQVSQYTV